MKRAVTASALFVTLTLAAPTLRADVKTTEKSAFKLEGVVGAMLSRMIGGSEDPTTVSVKGNRMSRMTTREGQIIDLAEERVYTVDVRRKEYSVQTFAELREQLEKMKADMEKRQQEMSAEDKQAAEDAARQFEFDVDVKETGQKKTLAGFDTREVVLTIAMRQQGRTLEDGGGLVLSNTLWLAPRVAALNELTEFQIKFFKAVYGGAFAGFDPQQMSALSAMMPGLATMMERLAAEGRKLEGTAISSTTVVEGVKSAAEMKNAPSGRGGGIGGMIARRMNRGASEQRTKALTTTHDYLSIAAAAGDADVAIPADFREKR